MAYGSEYEFLISNLSAKISQHQTFNYLKDFILHSEIKFPQSFKLLNKHNFIFETKKGEQNVSAQNSISLIKAKHMQIFRLIKVDNVRRIFFLIKIF